MKVYYILYVKGIKDGSPSERFDSMEECLDDAKAVCLRFDKAGMKVEKIELEYVPL